jgi:hypothetical protein
MGISWVRWLAGLFAAERAIDPRPTNAREASDLSLGNACGDCVWKHVGDRVELVSLRVSCRPQSLTVSLEFGEQGFPVTAHGARVYGPHEPQLVT